MTLNAYIIYLEMLYGTKYLVNPDTFGSGISGNSGVGNDVNYHKYGGLKYRKKEKIHGCMPHGTTVLLLSIMNLLKNSLLLPHKFRVS